MISSVFRYPVRPLTWIVEAVTAGKKRSDASYCYVWNVGDAQATTIVKVKRTFCDGAKRPINGAVVLTPRVNADRMPLWRWLHIS